MPDDIHPLPIVPSGSRSSPPPLFARIAIVGLSGLGASLALAARRAWPSALVIGVDRPEALEQAMRLHAVDVAAPHASILSEADLLLLAGPPGRSLAPLAALLPYLEHHAVLCDTGRADAAAVAAAVARLPGWLVFVGGGPEDLATPEPPLAVRPDMFRGCRWRLVPSGRSEAVREATAHVAAFVRALGAEPVVVEAP